MNRHEFRRILRYRHDAGFTLVELVVVIVIVGILAAFAAPRFVDNRAFAERGYYEELVAAAKFARKHAVTTGCPVRLSLTTGGYAARQQQPAAGSCDRADTSFPVDIRLADGSTLSGSAPSGVTPSLPAAPTVVTFDPLGRTSLGGDATIGVGPHAFTIRAASGYVETP